jgi:hypothetical protein
MILHPRCKPLFAFIVKPKVGESMRGGLAVAAGLGLKIQLLTQERAQRSAKRRMSGSSIGQMLPGISHLLARFGFAQVK